MKFLKNRNTRVLILILAGLLIVSFFVSKVYYGNINKSVDPRIKPARELYDNYNNLAGSNDFKAVLNLLDSVNSIYQNYSHYRNSFESGVLANNKAAVYITLALHKDSIIFDENNKSFKDFTKDSLLDLADIELDFAITTYENWKKKYDGKSGEMIKNMIEANFNKGLEKYSEEEKTNFLENRISELQNTQKEIDRRLSVSYTNKGIVHRHREDYESAIECYAKAMKLWDQNITAENNLNLLMGKPRKKRNFIQKMFPPEKDN